MTAEELITRYLETKQNNGDVIDFELKKEMDKLIQGKPFKSDLVKDEPNRDINFNVSTYTG